MAFSIPEEELVYFGSLTASFKNVPLLVTFSPFQIHAQKSPSEAQQQIQIFQEAEAFERCQSNSSMLGWEVLWQEQEVKMLHVAGQVLLISCAPQQPTYKTTTLEHLPICQTPGLLNSSQISLIFFHLQNGAQKLFCLRCFRELYLTSSYIPGSMWETGIYSTTAQALHDHGQLNRLVSFSDTKLFLHAEGQDVNEEVFQTAFITETQNLIHLEQNVLY